MCHTAGSPDPQASQPCERQPRPGQLSSVHTDIDDFSNTRADTNDFCDPHTDNSEHLMWIEFDHFYVQIVITYFEHLITSHRKF